MRASAYNFVIGGSDAHGKNYGLLLGAGGRFRLAPLYDIASWLPCSTDKKQDKLAMSVDGKTRFDQILPRHWEAEARKANYDPDRAVAHVRDLIAIIPDQARALLETCVAEGSATDDMSKLVDLIVGRCIDLARIYGAEVMAGEQACLPEV